MWSGLRFPRQTSQESISYTSYTYTSDLLRTALHILISASAGICLAWYVIAHFGTSWTMISTSLVTLLVIGAASLLTLLLLPTRMLAGMVVWLAGVAAVVTIAAQNLQQPALIFCLALIPLLATLLAHWLAGLLAEAGIAVLIVWLAPSPWMAAWGGAVGLVTLACGALTVLIGWTMTRALLIVTQWSLWSLQQAQHEMEESRNQKVELKQVQQDLVQANQELARLADVLKAANRVAEEARRLKEEFVANVSHELRTPLNMIIGFSEMIVQAPQSYGGRLPKALLADITAIQRNSQHLSKLVDDVLDLSQMDSGRMTLSKEWVTACEIVDEAVLAVRALYETRHLYLTTDCSADLPALYCDSTRIRQVILNLLSNAGRFTEHGGVHVRAFRRDDQLVISVSDTGPGIAAADQTRIFEPFQQLDNSIRRRHGGSGLGLTISKHFVEMHGGKLWLESEPGQGTTFFFSLPLESTQVAPAPTDGSDARRWFSPYQQYIPRTHRFNAPLPAALPHYVVLESSDTLAPAIRRYVDPIDVTSMRTMDDALRELTRSPAHALIINNAACEEAPIPKEKLSALPYGIPAVTCWAPGKDQAAARLGVVRYILKPVTHEVLLSVIDDLRDESVDSVQTVLIVDDQPEVLQLFARMLSSGRRRCRILQAMDGQRALNLLRERKPDVMLLDLMMPGMDGLQVLQEKSRDPAIRDIPVVAVTSKDPGSDPVAGDTLTVTHSGGLSMAELIACVQAVSKVFSPSPASQSADQAQTEAPVA